MSNQRGNLTRLKRFVQTAALIGFFLVYAPGASAATLTVSPSTGSFTVGSTFSVSVYLNSEGQTVNTVGATMLYPADRLQLVSPSTGNSIITLWTAVPSVDNAQGKIVLQGGIPNGMRVDKGIVTTLTFRVKAVGTGFLKFSDTSRVLLNDGKGSDVLRQLNNGVFTLTLPPPAGPIVASPTHSDQSMWYNQRNAVITWTSSDPVDFFSYVLNDEPIDFPDDIPEDKRGTVEYRGLSDGIHYFHIKASHENLWGGVTHFAIKIDATPPADFPVEILPGIRTTHNQPIVQFSTTDALSGVDHYELSIIPLRINDPSVKNGAIDIQSLFIEATSPYIPPELKLGTYDIKVKAIDAARNYREVTSHLAVVSPLFSFVSNEGITVNNNITIRWLYIFGSLLLIILLLIFIIYHVRRWHARVHAQQVKKELPNHVQEQLAELQRYRSKYGLLILILMFFVTSILPSSAEAASVSTTPPVITSFSNQITNDEILYVGGKSEATNGNVILYIQNLETGETFSQTTQTDASGEWFYRHNTFLPSGDYRVWMQSKQGVALSPPSPEQTIHVRTRAIQIGVSRISIEALYLIITILALMLIVVLSTYLIIHTYRAKVKHEALRKEITEAEESVKRGFAVLKRDIQSEIDLIHTIKLNKELTVEESKREKLLLEDLESVQNYIGKEIWDIEKTEALSKV